MARLLLLFILLPAIELGLLIVLGQRIGVLPTVALIVATGLLGSALARWQGLSVLREFRLQTRAGRLPAGPLVDGVIILMAAAMLITPGMLTDMAGFLLLIPQVRARIKQFAWSRLKSVVLIHQVDVPAYVDIDAETVDEQSPTNHPKLPGSRSFDM